MSLQTQINFLELQLEKDNVKNVYAVKNKIKSLKKKAYKQQMSFSETKEQFWAR